VEPATSLAAAGYCVWCCFCSLGLAQVQAICHPKWLKPSSMQGGTAGEIIFEFTSCCPGLATGSGPDACSGLGVYVMYAMYIYLWRLERIRKTVAARWDNPLGPVIIGSGLVLALGVEAGYYISVAVKTGNA
jgi:hypothetical protein